jgi:hypothetical protein
MNDPSSSSKFFHSSEYSVSLLPFWALPAACEERILLDDAAPVIFPALQLELLGMLPERQRR